MIRMEKTLVMLNWKRPSNVYELISLYLEMDFFDEIIVWNNGYEPISLPVCVINPNQDLGMNTRWYAGAIASTECIFYLDDDLFLEKENLELLFRAWEQEPAILHGFFGRRPTDKNEYAKIVNYVENSVEMIITKTTVTHRNNVLQMLYDIQRYNVTSCYKKNHQEDIFFSYCTRNKNGGKLHAVHKPAISIEKENSEDEFAICNRKEHFAERTKAMRLCQDMYGLDT